MLLHDMTVQKFCAINFLATQWTFPGCTLGMSMECTFFFLDNLTLGLCLYFPLLRFGLGLGSCSRGGGRMWG